MLIEIDAVIADRLDSLQRDPRFSDAMSYLALGHREGKHVVTAPRRLLDRLMQFDALDRRTRDTFHRIKSSYQDGQKLRELVRCFVRVCASGEWVSGTGRIEEGTERTCFRVPYHVFDDSGRVQPTCLLAEDADDARFYRMVARAYVAREQIGGIEIRCSLRGGGGSNTADELRASAGDVPVLCIVDSDRDWPEGALGETAKKALQAQQENADAISHVHVLPSRHVENLIPGNLVMDALPSDADAGFRSRCERARQVGILGGEELFHHLHVKDGLLRCDVFAARSREKQDFLRAICQRLEQPGLSWCQDACERDTGHKQPCKVFEGLGDRLFRHVVTYADELTPHKLAEYLFSKQQQNGCGPIWAELGEVLLSWTCAFKPIRV